MPDDLTEVRYQVALANRMLANEGVLDAFGHVSMRHPADPGRYLLSRSRSPALIEADDILEFTLDSEPVEPPTAQLYAERVIHGCIYQARPDVMAVCHHHAPAIMPFCIAGRRPRAGHSRRARSAARPCRSGTSATSSATPICWWSSRRRAARSRAHSVPHAAVLMNNHGATVVGHDVRELVFRAIAMCQNAEYQMRALALGNFGPLTPGETRLAAAINLSPGPLSRAWDYWTRAARAGRSRTTGAERARHRLRIGPLIAIVFSARRVGEAAVAARPRCAEHEGRRRLPGVLPRAEKKVHGEDMIRRRGDGAVSLWITEAEVVRLMDMKGAIAALDRALALEAAGKAATW